MGTRERGNLGVQFAQFHILVSIITLAQLACGQPLPPARQREILRDALSAFDQAVDAARDHPDRALQLYQQAEAGFQALSEAGIHNAALDYNLGNVYFRLGDLGRAILHYRRSAALNPFDPRLVANLRYARDRVEPRIAPSGESRLARQLLFWHYETSLAQRFWTLVGLTAAGWALLFAWLAWRRRGVLVAGIIGVLAALAVCVSLLAQIHADARYPPAVIVAKEVPLRLGRGEGSDLALQQPLGAGCELRILQQRGDWVEVRLRNDQSGWLPATAIDRI